MRLNSSKHISPIATEGAWLLGSWAFSLAALGGLLGFDHLFSSPLDIQMHNTYFVLSTGYAALPIFTIVATLVTVARGIIKRFEQRGIKVVLGLLALLWMLLLTVIILIFKHSR